jgi:hypothetical protein
MREAFRANTAHEGCAVVTFQKLGYPYMERKNKQENRNSKSNRLEDIDQQNAITTIHINIKIVGKPMLDKSLTGENVKVNGEIASTFSIGKPRVSPLLSLNTSAIIRYLICVYASHFFAGRTIYTKHRHVPELNTSLRQSLNWICQMGLPNIKI